LVTKITAELVNKKTSGKGLSETENMKAAKKHTSVIGKSKRKIGSGII
jgi:hypothetical protein